MEWTALIPAWLEITRSAEPSVGLDMDDALKKAASLREAIRSGGVLPDKLEISAELVEVLYALAFLLEHDEEATSETLLEDCETAFHFVETVPWPEGRFGGRAEVLSRLAFLCWRGARRSQKAGKERQWSETVVAIADHSMAGEAAEALCDRMTLSKTRLEDAELLLYLCERLKATYDTSPASIRDVAIRLYERVNRPGCGDLEQLRYFRGELALIAGTACRFLALRDESKRWFDLAEASFLMAHNASAHLARLAYQRLALRIEERQFDSVLLLAPQWVSAFDRLDLPEDALKCRFLEAIALKETDRFDEAKRALEEIRNDSSDRHNDLLAAIASQNLFQLYAFLGEEEHALRVARQVVPVLKRLDNKVGLAKLQMGLGYLLRSKGRLGDAAQAYRLAQDEFRDLQMHADVAATHLVLGDLLLDANQPAQAEWEIRAALPVIDELKLVPEGIAALSLLRESLKRRQIDRQALRSLNGYFEELGS